MYHCIIAFISVLCHDVHTYYVVFGISSLLYFVFIVFQFMVHF